MTGITARCTKGGDTVVIEVFSTTYTNSQGVQVVLTFKLIDLFTPDFSANLASNLGDRFSIMPTEYALDHNFPNRQLEWQRCPKPHRFQRHLPLPHPGSEVAFYCAKSSVWHLVTKSNSKSQPTTVLKSPARPKHQRFPNISAFSLTNQIAIQTRSSTRFEAALGSMILLDFTSCAT